MWTDWVDMNWSGGGSRPKQLFLRRGDEVSRGSEEIVYAILFGEIGLGILAEGWYVGVDPIAG